MLPTEVLMIVGGSLAIGGKIVSMAGKLTVTYVREHAKRIVEASTTKPQFRRLIINTQLDHIEREHSALKITHAQTVISNTIYLDRITRLETILRENGISIPPHQEQLR